MSRMDVAAIAAQVGAGLGGLGTKKTVFEYGIPVETGGPGTNTEEMSADETLGNPFPTDRDVGTQHFEPTLSGKCRSASLGRLLSTYFGDPVTTTPDAGVPTAKLHTYDPVGKVPRALSVLLHRADPNPVITDIFWDAIGQELALNVDVNDWFSFDASMVAREIDPDVALPAITTDLTRRFGFYECKGYASVLGGAETEFSLANFSLTYGLGVPTDDHVLGSRRLFKVQAGNRDASVSFVAKQDLEAYYRRAMALEPENMAIRLEALGPIIGGAIRHRLTIKVWRCFEIEAPADIDAGETLQGVDVSASASYDAASGKFVTVELVNTVANYTPA